ncbi:non-ribosomal peptide synthetase [Streptomyces cavourensis]|uniref:Amino acid adenylation domain-containing protein n=1 Tax=Streptomyces cavourensis TaxID=67258 RepID=A0ABY5F8W9_9ACTN|nr:non-ribosomal peptide synthetase [Streptomyces cavourensis]UTR80095.1 amino acid adenylation domain-containing protein [Streptomyces cavourensis]
MSLRALARMYADGKVSTAGVLAELSRRVDIPLSEGQRGLWALAKLEPETYAYNVPVCLSCADVDTAALQAAFRDTLSRHPLLSATVRETDDGPLLSHGDTDGFVVEDVDISDVPSGRVLDLLKERARRPFDPAGGPLTRLAVLRRSASEAYVLLVVHHLVIDGVSARLVIDTLFRSYRARVEGRDVPIEVGAPSFGEFVAWERDALTGERAEEDREFWVRELTGADVLTGLPSQVAPAPDAPHVGEVYTSRLPEERAAAVAAFTASHGISPGIFFLAAFLTLLHRYTGSEDLVIGMPVAARPTERFDPIVGCFVNTLPVRSRPDASEEFTSFARRVRSTVLDVLEHGSYPFHRIVGDLGARGVNPRSPLYQVVYNYQDSALSGYLEERARATGERDFALADGLYQLGEYDLTVDVAPGDGFLVNWKYHPDAFSADAVARMAEHFATLVDSILDADGQAPIGTLNLLDDEERRLVIEAWNRTGADFPAHRTCWDLFTEQAEANPDAPAVTCGERTLTYRELADRSAALARELTRRGVGPGDVVGVCYERSADLVVALLAVMGLGAVYLPLDSRLPSERLSYMVQDSGAHLVVCHEAVVDRLAAVGMPEARLYVTDRQDDQAAQAPAAGETTGGAPDARAATPSAAYIIYTSGSTGKPKGVVVPHTALTNFLLAMADTLHVTSDDRLLAITTHSFDIAALELYLPLVTGGQVCVADAATAADATLLAEKVADWRPTIMQATPATWAMLVRVGWRNTEGVKVLCGGEALPDGLKDQLVARGEAWNLYGPTETTIWSAAKRLSREEPVTIGSPIANTQLYVLDGNLSPLPVGVTGELHIAGDGVALGYHGKPELTADRFLDNPFGPGRLYRTGDRARRLPNGEIVVLGRMDNQVKLRGHRIEPGEIEAVLDARPEIARSVVLIERAGLSDRLTAYYTGNGDAPVDAALLRAELAKTLPAYMLPAAFVALDAFPLTPHGKVDRAKLAEAAGTAPLPAAESPVADSSVAHSPVADSPVVDSPVSAPDIERTVRGIFEEVLGSRDIDRAAGFFDIGGDSFAAIEAVERINRAFDCSLRPTSLFAHPSVAAMARHLTGLLPAGQAFAGQASAGSQVPAAQPVEPERYPDPGRTTPAADDASLKDAIAVIGISCRFPGALDHRAFWSALVDGRSGSTSWSAEELRALGVPEGLIARPGYVPQRSVVDGRAEFDAAFFDISPRDAEFMDPQARLLLQHAWQALEDAGYRPEDVPRTSVTTSTSTNFYQALLPALMANASGPRVLASSETYAAWLFAQGGTVPTMISTKLGLHGPSMAVSTNCSSALSAVHVACQGLLAGDAEQAIVGAASLFSAGELGYVHQPGLNFSSDGRSRAFADGADGMSGGEGVGVVVLKRAGEAIAAGDHIYCLIRGVAVNNDGGEKAGFYAPGVRGQAEVIRKALDKAGTDPSTISYVEAHGTGTRLGDPIEVAALTEAYRHYMDRSQYCAIGSVKSNIGHLDAAAGIAGLIKVALALEHGEVPRTLHCDVPSPEIDWDESPFFVADRNLPLDGDAPARAGLSSFGIGGTNAHAVLEQAPTGARAAGRSGPRAVVLSARDGERLGVLVRQLLEFLPGYRDAHGDLASLAYTLQVGRRAMAERVVFVADDIDGLIATLQEYVERGARGTVFEGTARRPEDELRAMFERPGELRDLLARWLEHGEWDKIAPLWVNGVDVDWHAHHGAHPPVRVSLPTYPFAAKRYWPTGGAVSVSRAADSFDAVSVPRAVAVPRVTDPLDAEALLVAAARPESVETFLAGRTSATDELDRLARPLVLAQLVAAGLFDEPVRRDLIGQRVTPSLAPWLDHTVTVLLSHGELVREGDFVTPGRIAPTPEQAWRAWREWKNARADDPELAAKTRLTERMIEALPAILSGRTKATAVMFPGGSFELVEPAYRGNATADYFNDVTAGAVRAEADARGAGIRLLEIGAGTGSTSERVFARLAGRDVAEYRYTDISKAFLIDAERRFADRVPYVSFSAFDVEREPGAQGLTTGEYDIVIANNVLHATEDIVRTVRHARALLRPGGVLVLNELARNDWWSHLTFGLLDGWWRFTDGRRIRGGPALSPDAWRDVLRECGFGTVEPLAEPARDLGQQVLLARAGSPVPRQDARREVRPAAAGSIEEHVRATVERILAETLRLTADELAADKPFADYGLDSLTGVSLVHRLNESLNTDLDPSVLFENPSIRRLTRFIVEEEGAAIEVAVAVPEPSPVREPSPVPEPTPVPGSSAVAELPAIPGPTAVPELPVAPEPFVVPKAPAVPRPSGGGREPVAIVGMSGRFPGARDTDAFWDLLASGRDAVSKVDRWDLASLGSVCLDGGLLDGVDEFDPLFFGISGAEAVYMEPQQRLFLQEAWRALEDAGHAGESLDRDRCGIYVGCAAGDYLDLTGPSDYPGQALWGNMNSLVPSRIAYYLDLHGPALAVDTACSSSLVSLYLACQALWAGEVTTAIAGGVYVQNSPRLYLAASRAGMLSPTGRSRAFDQAADGFVPAEGVGALVLKRLSDAEADGDHIHGVISGIGINHNGTTNGIAAPNGTSQERLIRQIYRDFAIDPAGIGLVEAHGTGTRLGDPVEFRALDRAFRGFTDAERFCSLGSTKASIGHAQAAAGVIGVIKTLLAMRHEVIPGLPHHTETNPSVTLAGSPFYVHTEPRRWAVPEGGRRRAAVTSLGASGTNAHAVIEQPSKPPTPPQRRQGGARLIALSAATEDALREQVARLARHCREHPDLDPGDVSHTLLLGRRHLRHRWACVVRDIAELESRCTAWLSGQDIPVRSADSEAHALARQFLDGGAPDFAVLFRDSRYRRVPLPGYPFARERYALPVRAAADDEPRRDGQLLTGDEFYLREHRIQGTGIAPGAMYLQWAAAAARRTASAPVRLHDVVFLRPLSVPGAPRALRVALRADGDVTRFTVSSTESAGDEPVLHCQGEVSATEPTAAQALDLPALLRDFRPTAFDPQRFYAGWRDRGIAYGPTFQGVAAVHRRDDAVLAQLRLPGAASGTVDGSLPHPALVDAAMQCMRLLDGDGDDGDNRVGLVFTIKSVEVLAPGATTMWALIRRAEDAHGADRIDIDLAADDGTVCLRLRGIAGRRTERTADPARAEETTAAPADDGVTTLVPVWDPVQPTESAPWPPSSASVGIIASPGRARDVLLARFPGAHVVADPAQHTHDDLETALRSVPELDHLIWVAPGAVADRSGASVVEDQACGSLHAFRTVKALLAAGYGGRSLGLTLITERAHAVHEAEAVDPAHAGVAGLAGATAKEYPNWRVRVADVEAYDAPSLAAVLDLAADPDGNLRIHRDGRWHEQRLMTVRPAEPTSSRLRQGGTYVIIGGAGALGTVISEYLIRRYHAQVVWLGRRPQDARVEAAIAQATGADGPAPLYLRCDATDLASLRAAKDEIVRRFGAVHGVIHSGLVFAGASLSRMSEAQFEDVLRGKVDASVRCMEVFGGDTLDFALFLSSINSYLKAIKQANYAAACTFLDAFALTVQRDYGAVGKVLNLGYCFNNAPTEGDRGAVVGAQAPLIRPDELTAAVERLCAAPVSRLTSMKFSPALNDRGIVLGDDEVTLPTAVLPETTPADVPEPAAVPDGELELVRARIAELTALAI